MNQDLATAVFAFVWSLASLYGALIAGRLLAGAVDDERHRTKNGLRRIVSESAIARLRMTFATMLLFLFAGVTATFSTPSIYTRALNAVVFIAIVGLLVAKLHREARDRRVVLAYDLRDDRKGDQPALAPLVDRRHGGPPPE